MNFYRENLDHRLLDRVCLFWFKSLLLNDLLCVVFLRIFLSPLSNFVLENEQAIDLGSYCFFLNTLSNVGAEVCIKEQSQNSFIRNRRFADFESCEHFVGVRFHLCREVNSQDAVVLLIIVEKVQVHEFGKRLELLTNLDEI